MIQKSIEPQITFKVMGGFILLPVFAIYFLGLPKNEESRDPVNKLKLPEKKTLTFVVLWMMNFASVGIIIDWSSLWLTKDLAAPLFLGGKVIVFFNLGEIMRD